MNQNNHIDTPLLRQLVHAGKAGTLIARGVPGGFVLVMRENLSEQVLKAQRGGARRFRTLDAVASYLKDLGASSFVVEVGHWTDTSLNV